MIEDRTCSGWWIGNECRDTMTENNHQQYWYAHVITTVVEHRTKRAQRGDPGYNRKAMNNCRGIVFW